MYRRQHNNPWIVMGITVLGWLLSAVTAHAQPRRDRRMNQVAQLAAQTAQPGSVAQIPPGECTDRAASARAATEAREAFRSRNLTAAQAAWETAVALCALPDRFEGRARTREARQGQLPDGEERLRLLDGAIADFREAVARRHFVQGFDASAIEATIPALEATRVALERRVRPLTIAVVRPPVAPAACGGANLQTDLANCGTCGNRCASGQACNAGRCQAVTAARPVVVPPTPNRTLGRVLIASGGVLAITGGVFAGLGFSAAADVPTLCDELGRNANCYRIASGTDPRTLASLRVPALIVGGAGIAAIVTGIVLELRANNASSERRPAGPTARPTASLDRDGNPFFGAVGTF